jgi:integrase
MTFYNRNGKLYIRINGKRISTKLKDTLPNRKLIQSYHNNSEFFNKFKLTVSEVPTLIHLCGIVLDEKEQILKQTSYASYSSIFHSRLKPYFKDIKVDAITRKDLLKFYNTFTDKSTLNIACTLLKSAFEKASIDEYINFIPTVSKPKIKDSNYFVNPFSINEIQLILDNCEDLQLRNLLGLAFYTGMRIGEIFGLTWIDVNFKDFTISIKRTITNGYIQTPKTLSSLRTIDMLQQAEYYLLQQKKITGLGNYVFVKKKGVPFKATCDFIYKWKKLLKSLNLDYRNVYQTRHSFASNMLGNHEDLNWVSFTLGHKSPKITLEKYSRYINIKRTDRKKTFLDELDTKSTHIC